MPDDQSRSPNLRFTPQLRGVVFDTLSGGTGDVSGSIDGRLAVQLATAYGPGRGGRAVNTREAAQRLGVSQRTVQKWLAGTTRPSGAHRKLVATQSRQAATTKRGRAAAVAKTRASALGRFGGKLAVRGEQGPTAAGREYRRHRQIILELDPAEVAAMLDAYERGGDRAMIDWLESRAQDYVTGWGFDTIDSLDLRGK